MTEVRLNARFSPEMPVIISVEKLNLYLAFVRRAITVTVTVLCDRMMYWYNSSNNWPKQEKRPPGASAWPLSDTASAGTSVPNKSNDI